MPKYASTPATINVIGNHSLTSALSKDAREAMTKSKPIATVKIPNCLDMNHLNRNVAGTVRLYRGKLK
jgi:hypothetical protein